MPQAVKRSLLMHAQIVLGVLKHLLVNHRLDSLELEVLVEILRSGTLENEALKGLDFLRGVDAEGPSASSHCHRRHLDYRLIPSQRILEGDSVLLQPPGITLTSVPAPSLCQS